MTLKNKKKSEEENAGRNENMTIFEKENLMKIVTKKTFRKRDP